MNSDGHRYNFSLLAIPILDTSKIDLGDTDTFAITLSDTDTRYSIADTVSADTFNPKLTKRTKNTYDMFPKNLQL